MGVQDSLCDLLSARDRGEDLALDLPENPCLGDVWGWLRLLTLGRFSPRAVLCVESSGGKLITFSSHASDGFSSDFNKPRDLFCFLQLAFTAIQVTKFLDFR